MDRRKKWSFVQIIGLFGGVEIAVVVLSLALLLLYEQGNQAIMKSV